MNPPITDAAKKNANIPNAHLKNFLKSDLSGLGGIYMLKPGLYRGRVFEFILL